MNLANVIISVFGAALNFYLLAQHPKPMYALLGVMLVLRAVMYGSKMKRAARTTE